MQTRFCSSKIHIVLFFFFSSRRRHTRWPRDWSSDVCSPISAEPTRFASWAARQLCGVTGLRIRCHAQPFAASEERLTTRATARSHGSAANRTATVTRQRSEERRVGKEWRQGGEWRGDKETNR